MQIRFLQCPDRLGFSRFRVQTRVKIATHDDFWESVFFLQLQPSCIHPSSLPPPRPLLCSRQTIVRIVRCAATENLQSSLDCARGLLWRSTTTPRVRPLSPADNPDQRRRRSTTKSVTPTFQVDDLHCIVVDARARHGPHLDTGHPSLLPPPTNSLQTTPVRGECSRRRRRQQRGGEGRENKPDRGLSLLETEDCLAGYCELVGRGKVALEGLYFDCIVAVFLLPSSFFSFLLFFLSLFLSSSSRG